MVLWVSFSMFSLYYRAVYSFSSYTSSHLFLSCLLDPVTIVVWLLVLEIQGKTNTIFLGRCLLPDPKITWSSCWCMEKHRWAINCCIYNFLAEKRKKKDKMHSSFLVPLFVCFLHLSLLKLFSTQNHQCYTLVMTKCPCLFKKNH